MSLTETTINRVKDKPDALIARQPLGWTWQRWHLWVLLAGLLIRIGLCFIVDKEASFAGWDGKEYYAYAQSLLAFHGDNYPRYFNSIRPPFYPIFLVPFVAISKQFVWPIQLVQSMIGICQAYMLAQIAGRWRGQRAGSLAFVMALFHPFLIYYCAFILTETLFIALLWTGIMCLQRYGNSNPERSARWLACGGLSLGLACLTRPTLQPFLVIAVFWIGWRAMKRANVGIALRQMAYFTLVVSSLLSPFIIYNIRAHGDFSLAPGGGQSMYAMSNSPDYLRMYEAKSKAEYYQVFERLVVHVSLEGGMSNSALMEEARDFRQNHRADWWRLQWYKFRHFWTPWLNPMIFSRGQYLLSLVATTPLFLMAAAELWRRRSQRDPFLVLLLGLVGV